MDKIGLMTYSTQNLGDEIQTLAAAQFLPGIDQYIDRDQMHSFDTDKRLHMIVNGYFLNNLFPKKLLPNLDLLFVAFHIAENAKSLLAAPEMADYYRKFEPIGCRDTYTVELLKGIGVDAYFSGCMTLTMRNPYNARNDHIVLADVFHDLPYPNRMFAKNVLLKNQIPRDRGLKVVDIEHHFREKFSIEERFRRAQDLLRIYAQAKMVITSRLHCALPCLALGTPVVFLCNDKKNRRFSGLIDLMHHYSYEEFIRKEFRFPWDAPAPDQEAVSRLAVGLKQRCERFVRDIPKSSRLIPVPDLFKTKIEEPLKGKTAAPAEDPILTLSSEIKKLQKSLEDSQKKIAQIKDSHDRQFMLHSERMDWLLWRTAGYPLNLDEGKKEDVAVVIGIKDRVDHCIENAIKSLRSQTYPKELIDVIVVDFDSLSSESARLEQLCKRYQTTYVRIDNRPAWNRAACLNAGIGRTTAKYLLLSDIDLVFQNNYIQEAVDELKNDPWQIAYCSMSYCQKEAINEGTDVVNAYKILKCAAETNTASYSGLSICFGRTTLFQKIGGLDEAYTIYGEEDTDLIKRFRTMGLRITDISHKTSHLHQWHPHLDGLDLKTYLSNREKNWNRCLREITVVRNGGPLKTENTIL